jgi:DNA (cytosine-5)-methyltransferase 1
VGAVQAGFKPRWGVEIRPDIAGVAEANVPGLFAVRADVATVNYASLPKVYHLHFSPSCKAASQANVNTGEGEEDMRSALGISAAIWQIEPHCITLENVWAYRRFDSFKLILRTLADCAYAFDYWHLNAADYGVPQTRKRLILIARKDRKPVRPQATHHDPKRAKGQRSLFWQPWVGWLESIQDLIPALPESEFAPWQLERLPAELRTMLVTNSGNQPNGHPDRQPVQVETDEPAPTVTAQFNGRVRAFLTGPAFTVVGSS